MAKNFRFYLGILLRLVLTTSLNEFSPYLDQFLLLERKKLHIFEVAENLMLENCEFNASQLEDLANRLNAHLLSHEKFEILKQISLVMIQFIVKVVRSPDEFARESELYFSMMI